MLTIDELKAVLLQCGVDESVDLNADILDIEFGDLGYDSLAVLEILARLQQRTGTVIPEDEVADLISPRRLLDFVNNLIGV